MEIEFFNAIADWAESKQRPVHFIRDHDGWKAVAVLKDALGEFRAELAVGPVTDIDAEDQVPRVTTRHRGESPEGYAARVAAKFERVVIAVRKGRNGVITPSAARAAALIAESKARLAA